jgi:hypothetical protein
LQILCNSSHAAPLAELREHRLRGYRRDHRAVCVAQLSQHVGSKQVQPAERAVAAGNGEDGKGATASPAPPSARSSSATPRFTLVRPGVSPDLHHRCQHSRPRVELDRPSQPRLPSTHGPRVPLSQRPFVAKVPTERLRTVVIAVILRVPAHPCKACPCCDSAWPP